MKLSSAGSEDRNKLIAVGAFVLIAAAVVYFEYFAGGGPSTPAPTAAAVSAPAVSADGEAGGSGEAAGAGPAAKTVGTTSAGLDPTLHMEAMLVSEAVVYSGSGRNIFSAASAPPPVAIPKPIAQARLNVPPPVAVAPPVRQGPPPPPPIDLKFFGTETAADGTRLAFLLHNDDVITASAGDVVMRRYKVVSIEAKTIQVQDMQYNNTQTLPLLTN
jgi:hypothetical protein